MASPGSLLTLVQYTTTPSPPPSGFIEMYIMSNTVYIQDSLGNVYAFGSTTAITQLTGDVTAVGPGSSAATVVSVGGATASQVGAAVAAYLAATSADTPSTLVERDSSGNFAANIITAALNGNATTATTATNFTGSLSGDVTGTQSATSIASTTVTGKLLTGLVPGSNTPIIATNTVLTALENLQAQVSASAGTAITDLTGDVSATGPGSAPATVNSVGGKSASAIATSVTATQAATPSDTPSTIVERDSSGNFSAGTITANLSGNATTSTTSTNFTGTLVGDVTGTQGATVVSKVDGFTAAAVGTSVTATQAATPSDTPSTIVERDSSGNFAAGTITANLTGTASGNLVQPTNKVIVQKNPGVGQFSSVAAAIASITTASITNPFEVEIEPGVYIEPPFTMKQFVYVTAVTSGTVVLVTSTPNANFITGVDNSGIAHCIISGATGGSGVGLYHQGTLGKAFLVEFCIFTNCTTCISTLASVGNPSKLDVTHSFLQAPFTTGILAATDGASINQVVVDDVIYSNTTAPFSTDVIVGHGVDLLMYINSSQFIQPSGNCIRAYDGAQIFISSVGIVNFAKAFWVQNTGAAPSLSVNGLQTLNNTVDVQVDHTGATGSISGAFSASNSTVSSNTVSVFTADPTDGIAFTGNLSFGSTFANRTDVTNLILGGPAMGVYSGGALTPGSGFIVHVAAGAGYYSTGVPDVYFTWSAQTITLTATTNNYIYFNNSGILTAGSSFPDTRSTILLGRVVTNGTTIEFIDASPLTSQHYGNLNDNFVREAIGPVFSFGCTTNEDSVPLHLDVSAGSYYFGNTNFQPSAGTNITFQTFYQNGSGGWVIGSTNTVDTNNYDNGSGTLQPIPANNFARHTLYVVGQGANQQYLFVYAQTTYPTLTLAQTGNIPNPPSYFTDGVVLIASIIVLQGSSSIVAAGGDIVDNRPRIGFSLPAVEAVGSVTSVALALPSSVFAVTGSPVTSTGTLTGSFVNQSANTVLAGPASGGPAPLAPRLLVSADVPAINLAAGGAGGVTGILPNANTTATSADTPSTIVERDGSGNFSAGVVTASLSGNATTATTATNFTGSLAGDVTGTQSATSVVAIQGVPVSSTAPTDAQLLVYNNGTSKWTPQSLTGDVLVTDVGVTTIQPNVITNAKLAQMATLTLKGNNTGVTANASDLTVAQVNTMLGDVTTVGAIDGNGAVANGLSINGNSLFAQSASATVPGMVNLTTQSFSGNKTFAGTVAISPSSTSALVVNTTSFILDSVNNALGIGVQPATSVMIDGINTTGASKLVQMTGYGANSTTGYRGRFARGTVTSPSAVQSGDILNAVSGRGYGASQFAVASTGVMNVVAGETFTNTSNMTYLQFSTTPTGSVTSAEAMRVATTGVTLGPQSASTAKHQINGGVNNTTNTISASTYTVDSTTTDFFVYTNSTSNAITITLPAATNGRTLVIADKAGTAATNHVTISPPGVVTINGANASIAIGANFGGWMLISDGTNWTAFNFLLPDVPAQPISSTVIDWSSGDMFTKTLSANTTFTFANAQSGQTIVIRLTNTASDFTVTWPTIKWPVQTSPVMTTGAFSDVYTILFDGTSYYGSYVQNF